VWMALLLAGIVVGAVSVALFSTGSTDIFGWITLACSVIILVTAAVGYRRSRLRP
jgi:hypothetical protein